MGVVCKTHQIVIIQKPKGMGGKMKEDIINLWNKGLTVEEIAEELGCSEGYVVFVLVHQELKRRVMRADGRHDED